MISYSTTAPAWLMQAQETSTRSHTQSSVATHSHGGDSTTTASSTYERGVTYDGARYTSGESMSSVVLTTYVQNASTSNASVTIVTTGTGSYRQTLFASTGRTFDGTSDSSFSVLSSGSTNQGRGGITTYQLTTTNTLTFGGTTATATEFSSSGTSSTATVTRSHLGPSITVVFTGATVEATTTLTIGVASTTVEGTVTTTFSGYVDEWETATAGTTTITALTSDYDATRTTAISTRQTITYTDEAFARKTTVPVFEIDHRELGICGLTTTQAASTAGAMAEIGGYATGLTLTAVPVAIVAGHTDAGNVVTTQTVTEGASVATTLATTTVISSAGIGNVSAATTGLPAATSQFSTAAEFYTTTSTSSRSIMSTTTRSFTFFRSRSHTAEHSLTWHNVVGTTRLGLAAGGSGSAALSFETLGTLSSLCTSVRADDTVHMQYSASQSWTSAGGQTLASASARHQTVTIGDIPLVTVGTGSSSYDRLVHARGLAAPHLSAGVPYALIGAGATVPYPFWSSASSNVSAPVFYTEQRTAVVYNWTASQVRSYSYLWNATDSQLLITEGSTSTQLSSTSTITVTETTSHALTINGATRAISFSHGGNQGADLYGGYAGPNFHGMPAQPGAFGWLSLRPGVYLTTRHDSSGGSTAGSLVATGGTGLLLTGGEALVTDTQISVHVLGTTTTTAQAVFGPLHAYSWFEPGLIAPP